MNGPEKVARRLHDMQTKIDRVGSASQLGNTTIGGETAVAVADVVTESVVTNDALPDVQEDVADGNEGVSDLSALFDSFDEDMDARFENARAELDDKAADIEASMTEIDETFSTQYEGLSEDVDTAIRAAGDARTEAEAASDAALAAAGLAASKGETIVQVSPPSGSRANTANLWIDISTNADGIPKNQPNRYNPDTAKWEPITDAQTVAAAQAAATAVAAAQAAKDVAAQANAAAAVAQQTASDANTAALTAAGIANGKGKVIYQASKPTGSNAAVGNLWIRSSDNTPWAFDTSSSDWVQVTDKAATDAAAAAAAANQAAVAASNAAKAAQATADSKPLILYSSTAGPSGTAPTGTIWFLWDSAKNIAGQWLQSGTLAAPVWTPQQIRSEVIANLDVAKLTAGSAAIADLVAQKIAAATGNFQTVNVSNLFVTSGATMAQATIDFLFANVVQAKKITAGMIDVDSLSGITLTGAVVQSSATGKRVVLSNNRLNFYGLDGSNAVSAGVIEGIPNGAAGGLMSFASNTGGTVFLQLGTQALPSAGTAVVKTNGIAWFPTIHTSQIFDAGTGVQYALGDTDWIQPTLTGGTNDTDSPFRYRRLNGVIYFDGLVTPGATNQRMFVLPAGFRPARIRRAWIDRNGTATPTQWIVRVHSGGAIDLIGPSGGSGALDFGGYPPFPAN
ncbi:hypothetical protein EDF51_106167 [Curtobacterium sp. PhB25]|uniref:hypothetical protein n=1 Tax=Curtobacterium sp. PhB25 TaxID=2485205 RepID=UPI001066B0C8|nr:hypothetical protein [Curtobacterium sp. PhB25]TDW69183.1 hypothetical protein EDF51_106167 [Curtobacterium sp. PhB25]